MSAFPRNDIAIKRTIIKCVFGQLWCAAGP